MLSDPARLAVWGTAGRQRAQARYSWDRIASDTVKIYQRALKLRRVAVSTAPGRQSG